MENFPLNRDDVKGTDKKWGDKIGFLTGKISCKRTPHIRTTLMTNPVKILRYYRDVTLEGYVMDVKGIRFINTIPHDIKFMMAENIANAEACTL